MHELKILRSWVGLCLFHCKTAMLNAVIISLSIDSMTHHDLSFETGVRPKNLCFPSFVIFSTCSPLLRHTALLLPVMYTEHYQVMGDG